MSGSFRASVGHNPYILVKKGSLGLSGGAIGGFIAAGVPLPSQVTGLTATAVSSTQMTWRGLRLLMQRVIPSAGMRLSSLPALPR